MKEELSKDLKREPTDGKLADAVNTSVPLLRRHLEVGQAARNKLIKVSIFLNKKKKKYSLQIFSALQDLLDLVTFCVQCTH